MSMPHRPNPFLLLFLLRRNRRYLYVWDSDNPSTHTDVYQNSPRYSAIGPEGKGGLVQSEATEPDTEEPRAGGRLRKELPTGLIQELSEQGLSIRRIVAELKAEGRTVSTMTVSRMLSEKQNPKPDFAGVPQI